LSSDDGRLPVLGAGAPALATFALPVDMLVVRLLNWMACTAVSNTKTTKTITIITFLFIFITLVFRLLFKDFD
jgi:hypothetical protein